MDEAAQNLIRAFSACAFLLSVDAHAEMLESTTLTAPLYLTASSITCRNGTTIVTDGQDLILETDALINEGSCRIFSFTGPATEQARHGRSAGVVWIKARSVSGSGAVTITNTGQNGADARPGSCAVPGSGGDGGLVVVDVPNASPVEVVVASVVGGTPGSALPGNGEPSSSGKGGTPISTPRCADDQPGDRKGDALPRRGTDGTILRPSNP